MIKSLKMIGWLLLVSVIAIAALWKTMPQWLPKVVVHWLPVGSQLILDHPLAWRDGALYMKGLDFIAEGCQLAHLGDAHLTYRDGRWRFQANALKIDTECLSQLPSDRAASTTQSLIVWQQRIANIDLNINKLVITPWQNYAGAVSLTTTSSGQIIDYRGPQLTFAATLDHQQQLNLDRLSITVPGSAQPLQLSGQLQIPLTLDRLPLQGQLAVELTTPYVEKPLLVALRWQRQQGELILREKGDDTPLAILPWQVSTRHIQVNQGHWRWPYVDQPLSGGIDLNIQDWSQGYDQATISARLNVITAGQSGKGNAVLTLGPGNISLIDSNLRFQISGQANLSSVVFNATLPGILSGSLLNPSLVLSPGALLRAHGNMTPELRLNDARWPLAGVRVTSAGINGRLQAIINAQDSYWGRFSLHLDGNAQNFWPDKGDWQWRYWGQGNLPPLSARWDIAGKGRWLDSLVQVDQLSTGFDHIRYGIVRVVQPRLTLQQPLRWQRNSGKPSFNADMQLTAKAVEMNNGGYLPSSVMALQLAGSSPDNFQIQGQLVAQQIGPIPLRGRWDGERLRGKAWWPKQSLQVFQPLLSPDLGIKLRDGEFYAQAAFSAARQQGFTAGGHWVVSQGSMWLKDGELSGLDFVMPYRLKDHLWQLGAQQPVMLRIASLTNLFEMQNITADLQGTYPYSDNMPLTLSHVGMDILHGHLSLSALRFPQRDAAVLKFKQVDLSELFTALNPKQFAMSGKVDGELPLFLNNPHWLVRHGWIANAGLLTLRLDKDLADSIGESNVANGAVIDWLRYLEIDNSYAEVNLDNLGELTLKSKIHGVNTRKNAKRVVVLNYTHQENIFQLWRSLRFGDNLQEWLQQTLSMPTPVPVSIPAETIPADTRVTATSR
ncbi:YdbH family protein [Yersinia ruckeri]|uniref:Dicarboxylate transport n=2 Tax=Yersinia ruckeri TaxID=29486 RepID=A0A085U7P9_YERRU|nr:YdbH family protein [Yersinia ruckeri]ARZ00981.1 hypothetical protein QMA0440_01644 [Yersinia ruckeri]EEQ00483.1 hypothetical protein yruck0001_13030 [Yersinia ruckeri ATCC 29473]EKN4181313.1 YdbH family protein [Yersinia ruckeri]EKN4686787.1 YdbH family protein [Yersinia ruckeri]EKN4693785.1 YdbH family protein [Yersinia ruckeri]